MIAPIVKSITLILLSCLVLPVYAEVHTRHHSEVATYRPAEHRVYHDRRDRHRDYDHHRRGRDWDYNHHRSYPHGHHYHHYKYWVPGHWVYYPKTHHKVWIPGHWERRW